MTALTSAAVAAYVSRIDAKATKHPRKFALDSDEQHIYGRISKNIATVYITVNGEIEIWTRWPRDYELVAPTAEEAQAIREDIRACSDLIRSVNATDANVRELKNKTGDDQLFVYRKDDEVLMVQQRHFYDETKTDKQDLPWSYWSDAEWRMCEPDGLLPLFGLDQLSSGKPVMIHEGAKGADHWQRLIQTNDERISHHPFGEDLRHYCHLGWPAGAPNPHRVDWSPIKSLPPSRSVTLVCDNDSVGCYASNKISKRLMRPLKMLRFDIRFRNTFDLADEWPKRDDWWINGHYVGPTMESMTKSITWATEERILGKKKIYEMRMQFAEEWYFVIRPLCFVRHSAKADEILNDDSFNREVRPYSDVKDVIDMLTQFPFSHADGLYYSPVEPAGIINVDGKYLVNTYRPSLIKPKHGDASPFLEFMTHLFPNAQDRHEMMRWCATLIAKPEVKMRYGVLLISEIQGVGKGTLGSAILAPLVGKHNTSFPSEAMLIDSKFNSWAAHKRLVVVHEIYCGHSRRGYDVTKSLVVDADLMVNRKYIEDYLVQNWVHIFACSNSNLALHLDQEDRRWFLPQVTRTTRDKQYWVDLYRWLHGGGLEIVAAWAKRFVADHEAVNTADHAPKSQVKDAVIEENFSDGARIARDVANAMTSVSDKIVVAVEDVRAVIAHYRGLNNSERYLEKSSSLIRVMLSVPGTFSPMKDGMRSRYVVVPENGPSYRSALVSNFDIPIIWTWHDMKRYHKSASDLLSL